MDVEKKILNILKKSKTPLSKSEVARRIKLTPATASKYIDILVAKKKVKLADFGNIHLVELEERDGN